jgi:hypothetical protein
VDEGDERSLLQDGRVRQVVSQVVYIASVKLPRRQTVIFKQFRVHNGPTSRDTKVKVEVNLQAAPVRRSRLGREAQNIRFDRSHDSSYSNSAFSPPELTQLTVM